MDVTDARQEKRYTIIDRLEGYLAGVRVVLVDVGEHGLQITHVSPIRLGTIGKLSFKVPEADVDLNVRGHVVWSRLADKALEDGGRPYNSGVRIEDPEGFMASAIGRMLNHSLARLDKDSIDRKRKFLGEREKSKGRSSDNLFGAKAPRIPDDIILLVKQTRMRLESNPDENMKWLNRAKHALSQKGEQSFERDEVLAVWEYLERSIDRSVIKRILDHD